MSERNAVFSFVTTLRISECYTLEILNVLAKKICLKFIMKEVSDVSPHKLKSCKTTTSVISPETLIQINSEIN